MALVVTALVAASCNGGDQVADTTEDVPTTLPAPQQLLRVITDEWASCLNPLLCDSEGARHTVFVHVLPRLLEPDETGALQPSPVLATAPQLGDGGRSIRYVLDTDARWADGRPITSTDIRVTWEAILATPGADTEGYDQIVAIDDRDPHVAVVELAAPYAGWRGLFGGTRGWLLAADSLGSDLDLTDDFLTDLPFSAGPFRLVDWDPQRVILAADEQHWAVDRRPRVDQVQIMRVANASIDSMAEGVHVAAQRAGGVSDPSPGVARIARPDDSVVGAFFDQRSPFLSEPDVREAIATALDRSALLRAAFRPGERAPDLLTCLGWLPDVGPWCVDHQPQGEVDADLAQFALLADGWRPGDDGVLRRGGESLLVEIHHDATNRRTQAVAESIGATLTAIGVEVRIRTLPRARWLRRPARAEPTGIGIYSVPVFPEPLAPDLYRCVDVDGDDTLDPTTPLGWCDERVQDLVRSLPQAPTLTTQREQAIELGDRMAEQTAWLGLWPDRSTVHVRTAVVDVPEQVPLGDGPLGALHRFELLGT